MPPISETRPENNTGNYVPYSLREVCGFFNVPCTSTEKMQETGPTAFRPYPRNKDLIHPVAYTLPNNRGFIALVIRFL